MKFIHLSDLHIGKRVSEFSMLEDQKYILKSILQIIDDEKPDAVMIAGDIYDKSVPSAEAVEVFDEFLVRLSKRELKVFIISGNHDSPERLAFGNRLIELSGVYLSPVYKGEVRPIVMEDEFGKLNIYMLPFIKPTHVRLAFPDREIRSYTEAVSVAIENMHIDTGDRNILITHQFVTGAERSDSEEVSVGGSDNVDASVFDVFDYVALGHIHGPQNIGSDRVRYCGTPLKYSFSEVNHVKSVTVVEVKAKGELDVRCVPLVPLHDMLEVRGKYEDIIKKSFYEGTPYEHAYLHVTLTDEDSITNAYSNLRRIFKNIMKFEYDNTRTRSRTEIGRIENLKTKSPLELFAELYTKQNGMEMSEEQTEYIGSIIEKIWEGDR